ncbi:phage repressor protein [Escherichia coli]|nr:phage repressor protein [Escherichia coli]EFH8652031.1 phage repressor protein [Escherichia coli]DAF79655.1 MAG TPA: CI repressor [Caudoviricetes sp.]
MDLEKGGRAAIERMVEAYGYTTRQALCDHLGVSKSTLATRYMRDSFPSEWVIQCALETGVSLDWLVTGVGSAHNDLARDIVRLPHQKIVDGKLRDASSYFFDKALLPQGITKPIIISDLTNSYLVEMEFNEIIDGRWIVEIEGKTSTRELTRIPIGKVQVSSEQTSFECMLDDIKPIARCYYQLLADV